jgi:hypothetical protein
MDQWPVLKAYSTPPIPVSTENNPARPSNDGEKLDGREFMGHYVYLKN